MTESLPIMSNVATTLPCWLHLSDQALLHNLQSIKVAELRTYAHHIESQGFVDTHDPSIHHNAERDTLSASACIVRHYQQLCTRFKSMDWANRHHLLALPLSDFWMKPTFLSAENNGDSFSHASETLSFRIYNYFTRVYSLPLFQVLSFPSSIAELQPVPWDAAAVALEQRLSVVRSSKVCQMLQCMPMSIHHTLASRFLHVNVGSDKNQNACEISRVLAHICLMLERASPMDLQLLHSAYFPFQHRFSPPQERTARQLMLLRWLYSVELQSSLEGVDSPRFEDVFRSLVNKRGRKKSILRDATQSTHTPLSDTNTSPWPSVEKNWPELPSTVNVIDCYRSYFHATTIAVSNSCAVCARNFPADQVELTVIAASDGLTSSQLEPLRVSNPHLLSLFGPQSNQRRFSYGLDALEGLLLSRDCLRTDTSGRHAIAVCKQCLTSLKNCRMPRLCLANGLFTGELPVQFSDLTWIEEMVCALYRTNAYVTRLFGSSDPRQPRVFKGNVCAHELNVASTADKLPWAPSDINDQLCVVFVGPQKFDLSKVKQIFRVRKNKIIQFLSFLKENNYLYEHIEIDNAILEMYPEDGIIPGLENRVIEQQVQDTQALFDEETAGFHEHPGNNVQAPAREYDVSNDGSGSDTGEVDTIYIENLGLSDPENSRVAGRTVLASAIENLLSRHPSSHQSQSSSAPASSSTRSGKETMPDIIIHRGSRLISEYGNNALFPGMFPLLYPYGIGGFDVPLLDDGLDAVVPYHFRRAKSNQVSFQNQASYNLDLLSDSFRKHHFYIFQAMSILQRRTGHLQSSLHIRKPGFQKFVDGFESLTPDVVKGVVAHLAEERPISELTQEQLAVVHLLRNVNTISKTIPGSDAAKTSARAQIRNYFGHFGLPQIFLTLNPSAAHSPVFQVFAGNQAVDLTHRLPAIPDASQRALILASDPVAAYKFFNFSIDAIFRHLFGWDYSRRISVPQGGLLGHVRAWYGTKEVTMRGGLHFHCLIWLVGGLNPSEIHQKLTEDPVFGDRFFNFFDTIIKQDLPFGPEPPPDYEPRTQRPIPPPTVQEEANADALSRWKEELLRDVKWCGEALQRHRCRDVCHKYGHDNSCRFHFPRELCEQSSFDVSTKSVDFKRSDATINNYNPHILAACRHNHDIRCILSGKSAKAAMFYICDYITKGDYSNSQMLTFMCNAILQHHASADQTDTALAHCKSLIYKCLSQLRREKLVHAQQAAMYLYGEGDTSCSHPTVVVASSLLMWYVKEIYTIESESSAMTASSDLHNDSHPILRLTASDDGKSLDRSNQFLDYFYRDLKLQNISYYEFTLRYEVRKIEKRKGSTDLHSKIRNQHLSLLPPHPNSETHMLVEKRNRGPFEKFETVPVIHGMSIPRSTVGMQYHLFCLAHFKPFSHSHSLLTTAKHETSTETISQDFEDYSFHPHHVKVMQNWESVYECEDERDAERLQRQRLVMQGTTQKGFIEESSFEDLDENLVALCNKLLEDHTIEITTPDVLDTIKALQQANWLRSPEQEAHIHVAQDALDQEDLPPLTKSNVDKWLKDMKIEASRVRAIRIAPFSGETSVNSGSAVSPDNGKVKDTVLESEVSSSAAIDNTPVRPPPATETPYASGAFPTADTASFTELAQLVETQFRLNEKQKIAYHIAVQSYMEFRARYRHSNQRADSDRVEDRSFVPLRMLLTGAGGTGKSHVVLALKEIMRHFNDDHRLRILAPTGSAAALVDGMTIHAGAAIAVKSTRPAGVHSRYEYSLVNISPKKKADLREEWRHVWVLLIDEVSMLGASLLCELDHSLRIATEINDFFGGIMVIFSGDFHQFPPVKALSLLTPLGEMSGTGPVSHSNRLGRFAFRTISAVVDLVEQQRMQSDPCFAAAVNRLRNRECTEADVTLFNSRLMMSDHHPHGVDLSLLPLANASILVETNRVRKALNVQKAINLRPLRQEAETQQNHSDLILCNANDSSLPDIQDVAFWRNLIKLATSSVAKGSAKKLQDAQILDGQIPLFIGMPVIIRRINVCTDLGVANGSQCIVKAILTDTNKHGIVHATCVLVEVPAAKRLQISGLPPQHCPIKPISCTFQTSTIVNGERLSVKVTRRQLPLQPAYAITTHLAQGKTLPSVIVPLHTGGYQAYVGASRATTREGLVITEHVTLTQLNTPCLSPNLLSEKNRFRALEHNTLIKYGFTFGNMLPVPDNEYELAQRLPVLQNLLSVATTKSNTSSNDGRNRDASTKRKRLDTVVPDSTEPSSKRRSATRPSTQQLAPTYLAHGCSWDSTNWSCAYDSVVVGFFLCYIDIGTSELWKAQFSALTQYSRFLHYEIIILSALSTTSHLNIARNNFRDFLSSSDNASNFPRLGRQTCDCGYLVECIYNPSAEYATVRAKKLFDNPAKPALQLQWNFSAYCVYQPIRKTNASIASWFQDQLPTELLDRTDSELGSVFIDCPPLLCVNLQNSIETSGQPSIEHSLSFPYPNSPSFKLRIVIYFGDSHFTLRYIDSDGAVWSYDGMDTVNRSRPWREHLCVNDADLRYSSGKHAIICIYCY